MWAYVPPLRDMRFVIDEVIGAPAAWAGMPAFDGLDADTAAKIADLTISRRFIEASVMVPDPPGYFASDEHFSRI